MLTVVADLAINIHGWQRLDSRRHGPEVAPTQPRRSISSFHRLHRGFDSAHLLQPRDPAAVAQIEPPTVDGQIDRGSS
jgi:hypothetical protein